LAKAVKTSNRLCPCRQHRMTELLQKTRPGDNRTGQAVTARGWMGARASKLRRQRQEHRLRKDWSAGRELGFTRNSNSSCKLHRVFPNGSRYWWLQRGKQRKFAQQQSSAWSLCLTQPPRAPARWPRPH
jgi:hypothetical protein